MDTSRDVRMLVKEYQDIVNYASKSSDGTEKLEDIEKLLVSDAEWSANAAAHLLDLANSYGSFMLKNALALSLALGIKDGEIGF